MTLAYQFLRVPYKFRRVAGAMWHQRHSYAERDEIYAVDDWGPVTGTGTDNKEKDKDFIAEMNRSLAPSTGNNVLHDWSMGLSVSEN